MQQFCFWTIIVLFIIKNIYSLVQCINREVEKGGFAPLGVRIASGMIGWSIALVIMILLFWRSGFFSLA